MIGTNGSQTFTFMKSNRGDNKWILRGEGPRVGLLGPGQRVRVRRKDGSFTTVEITALLWAGAFEDGETALFAFQALRRAPEAPDRPPEEVAPGRARPNSARRVPPQAGLVPVDFDDEIPF